MTAPHPVDRLAELKIQIADLEAERDSLRRQIITGEVEPVGEVWQATIRHQNRRVVTIPDAERVLAPEMFAAVVTSHRQTVLVLRRIGDNRKEPQPKRRAYFARKAVARKRKAARR